MKVLVSIFIVLLCGCATKPQESKVTGLCIVSVEPQLIWRTRSGLHVGDFMISQKKPSLGIQTKHLHGTLDSGTPLYVKEILRGVSGSVGPFLRISVEVAGGAHVGLVADLPACVSHHPTPAWIKSCTLDPDAVEFDAEIVMGCNGL